MGFHAQQPHFSRIQSRMSNGLPLGDSEGNFVSSWITMSVSPPFSSQSSRHILLLSKRKSFERSCPSEMTRGRYIRPSFQFAAPIRSGPCDETGGSIAPLGIPSLRSCSEGHSR